MKKLISIFTIAFTLMASTSLGVFATDGGEGNEVQSITSETTTTSIVFCLPDPITDTQISTSIDEGTTTESTTNSTETTTVINSTTVSASTNSNGITSGTENTTVSNTTVASTGTTLGTVSTGTTITGQNDISFVPNPPLPPFGRPIIYPPNTPGTTAITTQVAQQTTTTINVANLGAPKTGEVGFGGGIVLCGLAATAGLLMTFGKKED